MRLSRITRLAYGAVAVGTLKLGKVYPTAWLSKYKPGDMSQELVGETPAERMPAALSEVPLFCERWIEFLHSGIAVDLGAPEAITRPLLQCLHQAVRDIRDRPALPDQLRILP